MIQRIQTVFLLISTTLLILMFCFPMAISPEESVQYSDSMVLFFLLLVSIAIEIIAIFLYRHRIAQLRLCTFSILLLIIFQIIIVYYWVTWSDVIFKLTMVFPIISAILNFLAIRYIARDEAMVRSLSRLRKK